MTDATEQLMGLVPLAIGAKIVSDVSDTNGKKKKKSKRLSFD